MAKYIYLYGPDGSGKTAVALALSKKLSNTILVPFEPYSGAKFDSGYQGSGSASFQEPISSFKSYLLFFRYILRDLVFKTMNAIFRRNYIIIYTRGVLEFGLNNTHKNFPKMYSRFYRKWFQKNSVLLIRDVFEIRASKDELDIDDILRLYDAYFENDLALISNTDTIDKTAVELCKRLR